MSLVRPSLSAGDYLRRSQGHGLKTAITLIRRMSKTIHFGARHAVCPGDASASPEGYDLSAVDMRAIDSWKIAAKIGRFPMRW